MGLHIADLMGDVTSVLLDVVGEAVAVTVPNSLEAMLRAAVVDLLATEPVDPTRRLEVSDRPGGFSLFDQAEEVRAGIPAGLEVATIVWRLNTIVAATPRLVIHAGCVAGAGGVILPGMSGAGKSTLTAACVRAGMDYLSDEFAVIDLADGTLIPYPKPIGFPDEAVVAASTLRPDAIGSTTAPAAIIFPRFEPGAEMSLTPVDADWTLMALVSHSLDVHRHGPAALGWLAGLAQICPSWQVSYGDGRDVVDFVCEAATHTPSIRAARPVGPVTDETTTVTMGDHLAVFHEPTGRVHVLTKSAAAVWTAAADTNDPAEQVDRVLAAIPSGAIERSTVVATIDELTRLGLFGPIT